jgi:hypothetical protein
VQEIQHLKSVHDVFGADGRFVMIGLSLDAQESAVRRFVDKAKIAWPQGFLGDWSQATLPGVYGVKGIPSVWLIGPDGRVIAKNLRGEQVKLAVGNALAAGK